MIIRQGKPTNIHSYGATDTGKRRAHNEDCFAIIEVSTTEEDSLGTVLLVADGMGGAQAGEVASDTVRAVIQDKFSMLTRPITDHRDIERYLKNIVLEAHQQIVMLAQAHPEYRGMGTTVVLAWLLDGYMHVVWCGDSRCYVYPKDQPSGSPFTDDHSLVWRMVQTGELTPEEARLHERSNVILQALGSTHSQPEPAYVNKQLTLGERILLCSDGLNGMLSDHQIQQCLEPYQDLRAVSQRLIDAANAAGGADNITVVLAEVVSLPAPEEHPKEPPRTRHRRSWQIGILLLLIALITVVVWWNSQAFPLPSP